MLHTLAIFGHSTPRGGGRYFCPHSIDGGMEDESVSIMFSASVNGLRPRQLGSGCCDLTCCAVLPLVVPCSQQNNIQMRTINASVQLEGIGWAVPPAAGLLKGPQARLPTAHWAEVHPFHVSSQYAPNTIHIGIMMYLVTSL